MIKDHNEFNANLVKNFEHMAVLLHSIVNDEKQVDPRVMEIIMRLLKHQGYSIENANTVLADNFKLAAFIDSKGLADEFAEYLGYKPTGESLLDIESMAEKSLNEFEFDYPVSQEHSDAMKAAAEAGEEFKAKLSKELQRPFFEFNEAVDNAGNLDTAQAYKWGFINAMKVFTGASGGNSNVNH